MLDGAEGPAKQKAMDLLVRYGEALGAENFVDVTNIAGVPGSSTMFLHEYYKEHGGGSFEDVFSRFDLDSDESVPFPKVGGNCCHLQGGMDPELWGQQGMSRGAFEHQQQDEAELVRHGVKLLKTCTPYLAGAMPKFGEHCAWMESSAVVFCNSVLGARTNTEGRESTGAAMLTGRIPYWGYHLDQNRHATHVVELDIEVESVQDWGLLGYYIGEHVQERVPVVHSRRGISRVPNLPRLKHFGAAASSSGGVEMYHIAGVTPEALTLEQALGARAPVEVLRYGEAERRATYEKINITARDAEVQYVMLGCPHYTIEQIWEAAQLIEGRKVHPDCELWIFTPRAIKALADRNGYTKIIEDAGGIIMGDSCSAMSRAVPKGTKTVALDSAKQAHYLPAILGVQAWFGSTAECIDAACTGRWNGGYA